MGELTRTLNERGRRSPTARVGARGAGRPDSRSSTRARSAGRSPRTSSRRCSPPGAARRDRRRRRARADRRRGGDSRRRARGARRQRRRRRAVPRRQDQTFGFLVGQVMKASGGKANPDAREHAAPPRDRRTRPGVIEAQRPLEGSTAAACSRCATCRSASTRASSCS